MGVCQTVKNGLLLKIFKVVNSKFNFGRSHFSEENSQLFKLGQLSKGRFSKTSKMAKKLTNFEIWPYFKSISNIILL
jgi:hypothetical protein